jgi:predicted acyltransferase
VGRIALGALLAAPCVALIGLDGTLALSGALVLAYGTVAFARPAPAPVLETA